MPPLARRLILPLAVIALVFTGLSVPAHAAGADTWTKWNLGDKWIRSLDYVGTDLVAGSETSGVFRATSAAGPWVDVSSNLTTLGKQVRQTDNVGAAVYIATSAGLFKGNGSGGAWTQLGVSDAVPSYQRLNQGGVQAVRFPTNSASYLVVGTAGSGRDGIFWSSDSGVRWTKAGGFTGAAYYITDSGPTMYVAGSTGFWKSTDSGKSWTLKSDGIPSGESAKRIAVSPVNSDHLIAATVGGVYRSDNAGASWYDASGSGAGLLNVSEVRAFQLVPAVYWNSTVPRIVVGTNNGVWATADGGLNWAKMSPDKNVAEVPMGSESVYSLNIGFGLPGSLIAGTQGHGIFTLPLSAAVAPGSVPGPTGNLSQNSVLTAQTGSWTGSLPFFFAYQWKRCTSTSGADPSGSTCADISGATGPTYQLTSTDVAKYIRVLVRARSIVQIGYTEKLSASVGLVTAPPGFPPTPPAGGYPKLVNNNVSAPWGTTYTIDPSSHASEWWNQNGVPTATTFTYLWYRCQPNLSGCVQFDHAGQSYTTTTVDVNHAISARVIGKIGSASSEDKLAGNSGAVYEQTPINTSAPRVVGRPNIAQVLNSTAGSWTGNGPTFTRRWLRCNADGVQCAPTNPVVTTPTYAVQAGDKGYTFRIEVKASVVDDFATRSATVVSARTSVIGAALPSCAVVVPALADAVKAVKKWKKKVRAAKKALKKAQATGNKAKIAYAKKVLKKAKKKLRKAKARLKALQAQSLAGGC
jgi:hypothetical protein